MDKEGGDGKTSVENEVASRKFPASPPRLKVGDILNISSFPGDCHRGEITIVRWGVLVSDDPGELFLQVQCRSPQ